MAHIHERRGDLAVVNFRSDNSVRHRALEKVSSSNPLQESFIPPTGVPLQPLSGSINVRHNKIAENPSMVKVQLENDEDVKRSSLTGHGITT